MEILKHQLDQHGYCVIAPCLSAARVEELRALLGGVQSGAAVKERNGSVYGVRDVLSQAPGLKVFAQSDEVRALVLRLLGKQARMVRAIYFDKTPEANWKLPWHQDCFIAVRGQVETAGFDLWSVKSGIPHVRPPESLMARMLTLRFHLDDCNESNGALRIIPGSHARRLSGAEAVQQAEQGSAVFCNVPAGGVLAMKPLLVHSSLAGDAPSRRRVLHLEFSPDQLPDGLTWYEAA